MPYWFEKKKVKLPRELDRRVKLTDEQKQSVRGDYAKGYSIRALARNYAVSRRLIQFILFPERQERNSANLAARGGSVVYYVKEKHTETIRKHRRYKKSVLKTVEIMRE